MFLLIFHNLNIISFTIILWEMEQGVFMQVTGSKLNQQQTNVNTLNNADNTKKNKRTKTDKQIKSLFAGGIEEGSLAKNLIDQKTKTARKQMLKLIRDAWEKDNKLSDNIKNYADMKEQKNTENAEYKSKMNDIEKEKQVLKEQYGIEDDSQEQKDLELLEKYQNNMKGLSYDDFSDEELKRLKELQSEPLTEYQTKAMKLNSTKVFYGIEIQKNEEAMMGLTISENDARTDQAKSQSMLKAEDAADVIKEALNDEIKGALVEESKNYVDETAKENKEKAEKAEEKQKENDERIEAEKEKRKEQEELIKSDADAQKLETNAKLDKQTTSSVDEAQKNIQKILKKNNLINEDIKGIKIDLDF